MLARIIGIMLLICVLLVLFVFTGGDSPGVKSNPAPHMYSAPADNSFKDLKIN